MEDSENIRRKEYVIRLEFLQGLHLKKGLFPRFELSEQNRQQQPCPEAIVVSERTSVERKNCQQMLTARSVLNGNDASFM